MDLTLKVQRKNCSVTINIPDLEVLKKENIIDCIEQISNINLELIPEKTEINNNNFMMTKMFRFT